MSGCIIICHWIYKLEGLQSIPLVLFFLNSILNQLHARASQFNFFLWFSCLAITLLVGEMAKRNFWYSNCIKCICNKLNFKPLTAKMLENIDKILNPPDPLSWARFASHISCCIYLDIGVFRSFAVEWQRGRI